MSKIALSGDAAGTGTFTIASPNSNNNRTLTIPDAAGTLALLQTPSFATTIGVGGATPATSGAGITFPATQSASSNANTLDDYEEGTFTCTIGYNTNITSATSANATTTATGTYIKIGKNVQVNFPFLEWATFGGTSAVIFYLTLPFTVGGSSGFGGITNSYNISARYTGTSFSTWITNIAPSAGTNVCNIGSTTYNLAGGGYISFENTAANLTLGCTYIASA